MAEYIEREAVIELFNKWADGYSYIEVPTKDAIACGRAIPAADVLPVVLCKDCIYYYCETCSRWADGTYMKPNDFCSRSAKREES